MEEGQGNHGPEPHEVTACPKAEAGGADDAGEFNPLALARDVSAQVLRTGGKP